MTEEPAGPLSTWTTVAPLKTDPMTVGPMATPTNPTAGATKLPGTPANAGSGAKAGSGAMAGRAAALGGVKAGNPENVGDVRAPATGAPSANAPRTPASAAVHLF